MHKMSTNQMQQIVNLQLYKRKGDTKKTNIKYKHLKKMLKPLGVYRL